MTQSNIRRTKRNSNPKSGPADQKEVFKRTRKRLDKKRHARMLEMQWAHFWNLCPKCGGDMFEQRVLQIYFDVCRDCRGIYIEPKELDLALKHLDPKKLLNAIVKKSKTPRVNVG